MLKQLSLFEVIETSKKSDQETKYLSFKGDIPDNLKNGSIIALNREIPLKIYSLGFQPAKSIPQIL